MDNMLVFIVTFLELAVLSLVLLQFVLVTVMSHHSLLQVLLLLLLALLHHPFENAFEGADE